jgi:hypothetical protein
MNVAAVVAGLAAAAAFALSSALEQRAAKQEKQARPLDPRLLVRLLHRPTWRVAWLPEAAGTGLQALALGLGALALVEPLLISGLFLAIPLEAALQRRGVHARDFAVVAAGAAGLTAFLVAAQPGAGRPEPSLAGWLGVAAWTGPVLVVCLVIAARVKDAARGAVLGIASGLLYGVAASLLKSLTAKLSTDPLTVFTTGQLYALVVVGLGALVLNQDAFQCGRLAIPLTAITLLDPLTSVIIGVTALHERLLTGGPRLAIEIAAVLTMGGCIWLASTAREDSRARQPAR